MKIYKVLIAFGLTTSGIQSMEPGDRLSKLVDDAKAMGLEMKQEEINLFRFHLITGTDIFIQGEERPEVHAERYFVVSKDENSKLVFTEGFDYSMRWFTPLARQIYKAIMQDTLDFDLITKLLNNCDQHPIQNSYGETFLHSAAKKGNVYLVNLLIADYHYDVNVQDEEGRSSLHNAAEKGFLPVVELLVSKGAKSFKDDKGRLPIHYATETGICPLVQFFLNQGSSVNETTNNDETPLHLAVCEDLTPVVKILLEKNADVNALAHDSGPYELNGSPLHMCNNTRMARLLLDNGANIDLRNNKGNSPLHYAVADVTQMRVNMLVSYGAKIPEDIKSNPMVKEALENRNKLMRANNFKEIANVLAQGAYPMPAIRATVDNRRQVLFAAIDAGDEYELVVLRLLKEGFSLNTSDEDGNTLVHKAILANNQKCFNMLMFLGANKYFDKQNAQGLTPVHLLMKHDKFYFMTPDAEGDKKQEHVGTKRKDFDS